MLSSLKKINDILTKLKVRNQETNDHNFMLKVLNTWLITKPKPWNNPNITKFQEGPCHNPAIKKTIRIAIKDL